MTPQESQDRYIATWSALAGLSRGALLALWAMRVLDEWRKKNRKARGWMMDEGHSPAVDLCVLHDETGAGSMHYGTSPDAARLGAAQAVALVDPTILEAV